MRIVYILTWVTVAVFLLGETARRGIGYFSINETTMITGYICGLLLFVVALTWRAGQKYGPILMASAWAYAIGGHCQTKLA